MWEVERCPPAGLKGEARMDSLSERDCGKDKGERREGETKERNGGERERLSRENAVPGRKRQRKGEPWVGFLRIAYQRAGYGNTL